MNSRVFSTLRHHAASKGETNDCGVKAVAVLMGGTQAHYDKAHRMFAEQGRLPGKGVSMMDVFMVLTKLGIKHDNGIRYQAMPEKLRPKTIKRAAAVFREGTYLFIVKRHILACVDGEVIDWTANRKHRIQQIWKIAS